MSYVKVFGLCVGMIVLAGCSEPTIDASSEKAMKASVTEVRDSLPEGERDKFEKAVQVLAMSHINMEDVLSGGSDGLGTMQRRFYQSIDGKTAAEVFAEADIIIAERKERERQQALEEIRELEQKRVDSGSAREKLKQFEVMRSRFYLKDRDFTRDAPVIELTVKNGTDQAISRAYFEGTIASPDRSVPWLKDTFNYDISGGLEPGEEVTWTLAPNPYSDWGKVDAPADAVFTVTVERLDGADGEPLYSGQLFDEDDQKRLDELKTQYSAE
ncbi:DUF6694 family lipoprotein [Gilvimarinus sp. 1_MG-2023]|uniref:DUF6694 family lipoprotein n=1 Tax=Gilvimarinus sp. 1_MG-2023 TaxID=3062638 RepID=UPI0026E3D24C|nr:DUF6694 family lipoprotein [Gilvimarinus sp. 1_MG-2023]MDO6748472.1 hypothetical protein [Gilvimarinus sp. 1_MG-2023]